MRLQNGLKGILEEEKNIRLAIKELSLKIDNPKIANDYVNLIDLYQRVYLDSDLKKYIGNTNI